MQYTQVSIPKLIGCGFGSQPVQRISSMRIEVI
jgi:hypothetical protein